MARHIYYSFFEWKIARGIDRKEEGMTIATRRPCDKREKPFDM